MKYAVGVSALLLLVTALAFGQSYQPLPFPQEANTALQSEWHQQWTTSDNANLPPSMAADEDSFEISPSYTYESEGNRISLGSPFPGAADPYLGHHYDEMAPEPGFGTAHDEFPSAADPSRDRNR
jgi:hypothetical protein